jgi:hypothetical protein
VGRSIQSPPIQICQKGVKDVQLIRRYARPEPLLILANHPQTGDWLYDDQIDLARAIRKGPDMPTVQGGNSPVIPDGWVMVPVEPTIAILDEFDSIIDYGAEDSKDAWSRLLAAAWIKSLPAAPRQEVNRG